jgi:hypothetical protein
MRKQTYEWWLEKWEEERERNDDTWINGRAMI